MSPRPAQTAEPTEDALTAAQRVADEAAAAYATAAAEAERLLDEARQRAADAAAAWDARAVEDFRARGRQAARDEIAQAEAAFKEALAASPVAAAFIAWRRAMHRGGVTAHELASIAQHRGLRPVSSVDAWPLYDVDIVEIVRGLEREADQQSRAEIDAWLAQRDEAAQRAAEASS